jgi:hypothetical protein
MPPPTDSSAIPSDMDTDPRADEAVVPAGQTRPQPAEEDNALRDAIANAIDGSGSTPQFGDDQALSTSGSTGPGMSEDNTTITDLD